MEISEPGNQGDGMGLGMSGMILRGHAHAQQCTKKPQRESLHLKVSSKRILNLAYGEIRIPSEPGLAAGPAPCKWAKLMPN